MAKRKKANTALDTVLDQLGGLDSFIATILSEVQTLPKGHQNRLKFYFLVLQVLLGTEVSDDEGATLEEKQEEFKRLMAEMDEDD